MRAGKGSRAAALFLCLTLMLSTLGVAGPVDAADPSSGLCEHHPVHTAECGYTAPSEGSPCGHVHDASCGYAEATAGSPCQFVCRICAASGDSPAPEATATAAPTDTPMPMGDPGMDGPGLDEPSPEEYDIMQRPKQEHCMCPLLLIRQRERHFHAPQYTRLTYTCASDIILP